MSSLAQSTSSPQLLHRHKLLQGRFLQCGRTLCSSLDVLSIHRPRACHLKLYYYIIVTNIVVVIIVACSMAALLRPYNLSTAENFSHTSPGPSLEIGSIVLLKKGVCYSVGLDSKDETSGATPAPAERSC